MSIATSASRFACLPDDESADWKAPKIKAKSKGESNSKKVSDNKPKDKAKQKAQQEAKALQNLAFGGQKKNKNKKKGKGDSSAGTSVSSPPLSPESTPAPEFPAEPSEEWKEKDKQLADDNFTQAMQQAILISQLEFEKKEAHDQAKAELISNGVVSTNISEVTLDDLNKEERKKAVKAGKKSATMSLDQFQAVQDANANVEVEEAPQEKAVYKHPRFRDRAPGEKLPSNRPPKQPPVLSEIPALNFFNQMDQATVVALNREQMRESFRNQEMAGSESALVANYREKLVDKEGELIIAKAEIADLREKLSQAKTRTKKLTEILMQAEMKEKTEVLVQVHKLETIRDELSAQLSVTLAEQEQARSLVSALECELRKVVGTATGPAMDTETAARMLALIRTSRK